MRRLPGISAGSVSMLAIALAILVGRPLVILLDSLVRHGVVTPGLTQMIRWQSHWHVVRQSWPFFQNDFAGRIAGVPGQFAAPEVLVRRAIEVHLLLLDQPHQHHAGAVRPRSRMSPGPGRSPDRLPPRTSGALR